MRNKLYTPPDVLLQSALQFRDKMSFPDFLLFYASIFAEYRDHMRRSKGGDRFSPHKPKQRS